MIVLAFVVGLILLISETIYALDDIDGLLLDVLELELENKYGLSVGNKQSGIFGSTYFTNYWPHSQPSRHVSMWSNEVVPGGSKKIHSYSQKTRNSVDSVSHHDISSPSSHRFESVKGSAKNVVSGQKVETSSSAPKESQSRSSRSEFSSSLAISNSISVEISVDFSLVGSTDIHFVKSFSANRQYSNSVHKSKLSTIHQSVPKQSSSSKGTISSVSSSSYEHSFASALSPSSYSFSQTLSSVSPGLVKSSSVSSSITSSPIVSSSPVASAPKSIYQSQSRLLSAHDTIVSKNNHISTPIVHSLAFVSHLSGSQHFLSASSLSSTHISSISYSAQLSLSSRPSIDRVPISALSLSSIHVSKESSGHSSWVRSQVTSRHAKSFVDSSKIPDVSVRKQSNYEKSDINSLSFVSRVLPNSAYSYCGFDRSKFTLEFASSGGKSLDSDYFSGASFVLGINSVPVSSSTLKSLSQLTSSKIALSVSSSHLSTTYIYPTNLPTQRPSRPSTQQSLTLKPSVPNSMISMPSSPVPTIAIPTTLPSLSNYPSTAAPSTTAIPSSTPTSPSITMPTTVPTNRPSYTKTVVPSAFPSSNPSSRPTTEPTALPTLFSLVNSDDRSGIELFAYLNSVSDTNILHYFEVRSRNFWRNSNPWVNFTESMRRFDTAYDLTSLTLTSFAKTKSIFTNSTSECDDAYSLGALRQGIMQSYPVRIFCGKSKWVLSVCSDKVMNLCVDCEDPCVASSPVLRVPNYVSSSINKGAVAISLTPMFSRKKSNWPYWDQRCYHDTNTVTLSFNMTSAGIIRCKIVDENAPRLTTPQSISGPGVFTLSNQNGIASGEYNFTSLPSLKSFRVICYTEALVADSMSISVSPISEIYEKSCVVTTSCCTPLSLQVTAPGRPYLVGLSPQTVQLQLKLPPVRNVTITPKLDYVGRNCSRIQLGLSRNNQNGVLFPNTISFSSDSNFFTDMVYLSPTTIGCYMFTVLLDTMSIQDYEVTYVSSAPSNHSYILLEALAPTAPVPISVVSLVYTITGFQLLLTLDSPSDCGVSSGLPSGPWSCSRLLNFTGASMSTCLFTTSSTILADLSNSVELPVEGAFVGVAGQKIKSYCDRNIDPLCLSSIYLPATTVKVTLSSWFYPSVTLNAPSQVSLGSPLVLSLFSSSGNGGRPWRTIEWSVLSVSQNRTQEQLLEETLKEKLWFDCTPGEVTCNVVEADIFSFVDTFSIRVGLENYLGRMSYDFQVVALTGVESIPQLTLVGPSDAVYANASVTITAIVDPKSIPSRTSISYIWTVYRNDVLDMSIRDGAIIDDRVFQVSPYSLSPGAYYSFQATVIVESTGKYSSDRVSLLVLQGDIIPVISGSSESTVFNNEMVTLDASQSFDTSSGTSNSLSFQWSCVQMTPFNTTGCDILLQDKTAMSMLKLPKLSFPSSLLNFAVSYVFQVRISALSMDPVVASKKINTVMIDIGDAKPSIQIINPIGKLDNTNTVVLESTVNFHGKIDLLWTIDGPNAASVNSSFQSIFADGMFYFPFRIQANSLIHDSLYTLTLSSTTLTSFDKKLNTIFSVTIVINDPPNFGYVKSTPTSGDENTLFTIFAMNWQDADLPIQYSFYQGDYKTMSQWIMIRQKSEITFTSSLLSSGRSDSQNLTVVQTVIVDMYDAKSNYVLPIVVLPSQVDVLETLNMTQQVLVTAALLKDVDMSLSAANYLLRSSSASQCTASTCMEIARTSLDALKTVIISADMSEDLLLSMTQTIHTLSSGVIKDNNHEITNKTLSLLSFITSSLTTVRDDNVANFLTGYFGVADKICSNDINRRSINVAHRLLLRGPTVIASNNVSDLTNSNVTVEVSDILNALAVKLLDSSLIVKSIDRKLMLTSDYFEVELGQLDRLAVNSTLPLFMQSALIPRQSRYAVVKNKALDVMNCDMTVFNNPNLTKYRDCQMVYQMEQIFINISFSAVEPIDNHYVRFRMNPISYVYNNNININASFASKKIVKSAKQLTSSKENVTCPMTGVISYTCGKNITNGPDYHITNLSCQAGSLLEISCPLYQLFPICNIPGYYSDLQCSAIFDSPQDSISCLCPLSGLIMSTANSSDAWFLSNHLLYSFQSQMSISTGLNMTEDMRITHHVRNSSPIQLLVDGTSSAEKSLGMLGIIVLVIAFVAFFVGGALKLKSMSKSSTAPPVQTTAEWGVSSMSLDNSNCISEVNQSDFVSSVELNPVVNLDQVNIIPDSIEIVNDGSVGANHINNNIDNNVNALNLFTPIDEKPWNPAAAFGFSSGNRCSTVAISIDEN